jgi:hypothetical protein
MLSVHGLPFQRIVDLARDQQKTLRCDYHEEALTQLRDLVPAAFSGRWEVQVTSGDAADTIVRTATELPDCDGNARAYRSPAHSPGECCRESHTSRALPGIDHQV